MILALCALAAQAADHRDLELLYTQARHREGLALAQRRLAASPQDVDLHWLLARSYFAVGETIPRDDAGFDKEAWYEEMLAVVDAGLALDPDHPHLLFARGAALARLGTTRGIMASLALADDVEAAWLAAARSDHAYASLGREEVLPCDIYVCLGIFYRLVPDLWVVESLTGTRGDIGKSLSYLERAARCSPDRVNVLKELGASQLCYGQLRGDRAVAAAGMETLRRAYALPTRTAIEALDRQHAGALLADPDLACGYSRDGQQENR